MGIFETGDMVGLDVTHGALMAIYEETKDPRWFPPAVLRRKIMAGGTGGAVGFFVNGHKSAMGDFRGRPCGRFRRRPFSAQSQAQALILDAGHAHFHQAHGFNGGEIYAVDPKSPAPLFAP